MLFFAQTPIYNVPPAYVAHVDDSVLGTIHLPVILKGPTRQEIEQKGQELANLFKNGFRWNDLAKIIHLTDGFLSSFPSLNLVEKRDALIQILDQLIDSTDTPLLPDQFTDPLFKAMVPPFVTLLLTYRDFVFPSVVGKPSFECMQKTTKMLRDAFSDGFQWQDLASVLQFSVQFASQFSELSPSEKATIVNELVDFVIDATDTPELPDAFTDPIFKALIHPMVELIFHST